NQLGRTKASLDAREGTTDGRSTRSFDGTPRLAGFSTTRRAQWLVYVGTPTETALAPVRAELRSNLLVGAGMMLVAFGLAAIAGERIVAPLRELARDAQAFGAGKLWHRSRIRSTGEIGILAHTLNDM